MDGWRGRFYEDFEVGEVFRHPLGRTISDSDNSWFTLLTMNTNQLHFNHDYASKSQWDRPLVNSCLTLAVVVGQSVVDTSQNAIANLGWTDIRLVKPVYAGDTLYAESRVVAKRESKSRSYAGIVSVQTRGINQEGDVCITFLRSFLIMKESADERIDSHPETREPWPDVEDENVDA